MECPLLYTNINVKRLYCLAHIGRRYFDIVSKLKDEALKDSRAVIGFNFCEQLYAIEKELREKYLSKEDYYDKCYKIGLEKSAPIIEEFIKYVEVELKNALPRSPLGKALEYSKKLLPSFRIFLTDGSLEIFDWYNNKHYHSALNFLTPSSRHNGSEGKIIKKRIKVYKTAKAANPQRFNRGIRKWELEETVSLNPRKEKEKVI